MSKGKSFIIKTIALTLALAIGVGAGFGLSGLLRDKDNKTALTDNKEGTDKKDDGAITVKKTSFMVGDEVIQISSISNPSKGSSNVTGKELPKLKSISELLSMLQNSMNFYGREDMGVTEESIAKPSPSISFGEKDSAGIGAIINGTVAPDYSQTNGQVNGISEGDIVITDGNYIYAAGFDNAKNSYVVKVVSIDGENMTLVSTIEVASAESYSYISEMYIEGNNLVVVSTRNEIFATANDSVTKDTASKGGVIDCIWYPSRQFTSYSVYDVTDKENPAVGRTFEVEGNALATRMIGNTLYFVSNRYMYGFNMEDMGKADLLPIYRDTAVSKEFTVVPVEDIYYFPNTTDNSYMMLGAFDVTGNEPVKMDTYLGAGQTVYMSKDNLYIARSVWEKDSGGMEISRFSITGNEIDYAATGKISGNIINQYSMDEYNGHLRVATTDWGKGNRVLVLDDSMSVVGRTDALAPDESIQAVRFTGDFAYVVTYRQMDPFFVIDLKDPRAPKVLGELKIPGFSQYLHVVGDGLVVGFGRETLELYIKVNGEERPTGNMFDAGLKVSLFDVTNPAEPRELDKLVIEGAYADAVYNPRSMMVDKSRNIFGFSAYSSNYERDKNIYSNWAGYMLVGVENNKLAKLAQLNNQSENQGGNKRMAYSKNTLYTIDDYGISAYNYLTYEFQNRLVLSEVSVNGASVDGFGGTKPIDGGAQILPAPDIAVQPVPDTAPARPRG